MKILFLAVRDTGGTAYTLAHAINKITPEHQAVNAVSTNTFIRYPIMVDWANYRRSSMRRMIYESDVIVFLGAVSPFFKGLNLTRKKLRDKKKLLLCMGSEWRLGRDQLVEQADKYLQHYKIALGGSDMFLPLEFMHPQTGEKKSFPEVDTKEVAYLPVVRSFDEIQAHFGLNPDDEHAVEAFGVPRKRVIFVHAPTSETNKGSRTFYRAATQAQQVVPQMVFTTVKQLPWVTTLGILAGSDVLYDQAPPFPTAYGALSVEAGIFSIPSFSQVAPECRDFIKRETGLDTPFIVFTSEEDLFKKTVMMAQDPELRRQYGKRNYEYCKQLHDEKPVVDRFMQIVEAMD